MPLTPTNLYMNWSGTTITPAGGSTINIPEVTDMSFGRTGNLQSWKADAHMFATLCVNRGQARPCKITGGAINILATIPINTPCTIVSVLNDAKNANTGAGSGALTHTLVNAVLNDNPWADSHEQWGKGDLTFSAFSTDGTTDPLTIAQA